jgi:hypothetical protein
VRYHRPAGRFSYGGPSLAIARALAAAAFGTASRVLLSGAAFKRLSAWADLARTCTVLNIGCGTGLIHTAMSAVRLWAGRALCCAPARALPDRPTA